MKPFLYLETPIVREPENPCIPTPCGPNSQCRELNGQAVCSCVQNYIGRPPNCRPECMINSECPSNLACINERCKDPCPGSCGFNTVCSVIKHSPVCSCSPGYTGDPFSGCSIHRKICFAFVMCISFDKSVKIVQKYKFSCNFDRPHAHAASFRSMNCQHSNIVTSI
jgi:hypothetical protein